jgi:hypothetical protein
MAWLIGLAAVAASAAAAQDQLVVAITRADCARLVAHRPAADVTYQPGVDVNGQPVVPADLDGGTQIVLPEIIYIPITVDLFDHFGIPADPDNFQADAEVGAVIYRDGRAYFNGQPLQDDAQAELAALCQNVTRGQP